jgi:hypothetical protein
MFLKFFRTSFLVGTRSQHKQPVGHHSPALLQGSLLARNLSPSETTAKFPPCYGMAHIQP